jgi:hypothetical protein
LRVDKRECVSGQIIAIGMDEQWCVVGIAVVRVMDGGEHERRHRA